MVKFNFGWYLIYTRPKQEHGVSCRLTDRKILSYLPLIKETRNWKDRKKVVQSPVFPSYVFVYLNTLQEFYDAGAVDGACYYVRYNNCPARVSEEDIKYIRMIEGAGKNIEVCNERFLVGQRLVITEGPLNGLSCEVASYKGKNRILVRLAILQRSLLADLPLYALAQDK